MTRDVLGIAGVLLGVPGIVTILGLAVNASVRREDLARETAERNSR